MNAGDNYYLGMGLRWRGLLTPKVTSMKLQNNDGSYINENPGDKVQVSFFIDFKQGTGGFQEDFFLEAQAKGTIEYIPVTQADIDDFNLLVLRIAVKEPNYENNVKALVINYRISGIPKRQTIPYSGFYKPREDS